MKGAPIDDKTAIPRMSSIIGIRLTLIISISEKIIAKALENIFLRNKDYNPIYV
jgi:hypothetical protein